MEDIPSLPTPGFPEPHFLPPEHPPMVKQNTPRWTKIWAIVVGSLGLLLILFQLVGMWAATSFRQSVGGDAGGSVTEFMPRIVGTVIFFLIAAALPYVILKIKGNRPPRVPLATDYLRPQHLRVQEFGVPGQGLSAARFGNRAELGKIGEERTAAVLRKAALELCPSARVVHGLSWPGKDHADIDHALLVGNVLMLIDSKYMKDGQYWFDNADLYRDGEQLETFKLGYALSEMQRRFPGVAMRGVVVMHSTTGKLQRPTVEMANTPHHRRIDDTYAPVAVMNPSELINLLQAHIRDCNDNAVHVPVLRELLSLSK
ncbi:nuclease-related domain-containing protein [Brevibacterium permense]|uniref:nuclease-related domain-containing protein n=1 Tax=Brevibacterium permense TaxID=234834 RepID=UPI0021D1DF0B|nr:nuclease-related domain-containing protein [Brevibacterium permense]